MKDQGNSDLRRASFVSVSATVVLVGAMALLPVLTNPRFYLSDDSAAQFLPTWHYVGAQLRAGHFPLLDPSLWAGGNLAAEALFGLYNPLVLANMVLVSMLPDLLVAAVIAKTGFLVILGLGVYGLAREYGVPQSFAIVPAVSVPFAGVTLYWDATSWFSALIAFAFVPHFWWTLRRSARGGLSPLAPFAAGYLAITSGNPYGALGVCLVGLSLTVEFALMRQWRAVRRTILGGIAAALVLPLVYLPLVLTKTVSTRSDVELANTGFMVPGLGDLLNASTPSFAAWISTWGAPFLSVPATYLAWYVVPLLPWLRYDVLRRRLPAVSGLLVFAAIALMLCTGPSDVWMFRWPLRVMPYLVLPVAVLFTVALSQGLARSQPGRRAAASAVLILGGAYLAESTRPDLLHIHVAAALLVGTLVTTLVLACRRLRWRAAPVAVLVAGCVAVLAFQVTAFPRNLNYTNYQFPTSVPEIRTVLVPRYQGTTLLVAHVHAVQRSSDPRRQFSELMFGNMLQAVGVHAVNSYAGMGFKEFTDTLCMEYHGSVCPDALVRVWQDAAPGAPRLADLLRLETIVVQNDLFGSAAVPVPAGWWVAERNSVVTVLHRQQSLPYPDGRLSDAPAGTVVIEDVAMARSEYLRLEGGPGGTLTFARLAWPGYTAYLDGVAVPVRQGPAGLLSVDIPPGASGQLILSWSPPGLAAGVLIAVLGAELALAQSLTRSRRHVPHIPHQSSDNGEGVPRD